MNRLLEEINIVSAGPAADLNSDYDGDWVSLKNYEGCLVMFHKNAGTAGDDPSILLLQATDVSGTSSKALNFDHVYAKVGATALSGVGTFTKYTGTATNDLDTVSTFGTDIAADVGESLFIVDVKADSLDVTNGFDCIQFSSEGDDLGNSTYGVAYYILYGPRYPGATPLTAITD